MLPAKAIHNQTLATNKVPNNYRNKIKFRYAIREKTKESYSEMK